MRKHIIMAMAIMALSATSANAAGPGAMVTGKCGNTLPIASTMHLDLVHIALTTSIETMQEQISAMLARQTAALQASETSTAQAQEDLAAKRQGTEVQKDLAEKLYDFQTADAPVGWPCPPDITALMQTANHNLADANRILAEESRNFGQGLRINGKAVGVKDRVLIRGEAAKEAEKNGVVVTAYPVFTDSQFQAWNNLRGLLLPEPRTPRPEGLEEGSLNEANYLAAEAKAREARVIIDEPLRQYGLDRVQEIPAGEVYAWVGPYVTRPTTTVPMVDKHGQIDSAKTKTIVIDDAGKISRAVLLQLVGERFTSEEFLAQADMKGEAGVLKEILRLMGYQYEVQLRTMRALEQANLMKSLEMSDQLQRWNNEPGRALERMAGKE